MDTEYNDFDDMRDFIDDDDSIGGEDDDLFYDAFDDEISQPDEDEDEPDMSDFDEDSAEQLEDIENESDSLDDIDIAIDSEEQYEEAADDEYGDEVDSQFADEDGTVIDGSSLLDDDDDSGRIITSANDGNNFIGDTNTAVVVASGEEDQDTFKIIYVDITNVAVTHRIRSNPNVDELAKQIRETGLLEPITVALTQTKGVYVLLDGFRRLLACAKLKKPKIPCVVNRNINVPDIPIIEALYNKNRTYTIKEMIGYIDYLEKEKGVMNAQLIEYLLPLNPGDYNKLKDILADNDDDILDKLYNGTFQIEQAFKKVEKKRKAMNADEKEAKKAEQANENGADLDKINDQGEEINESETGQLTDDQVAALNASAASLEEGLDDQTVEEMDAEANNIDDSFKPHQQKTGEREYIDPNLKKSVLVRDGYKCWCCKTGGEAFVDVLDFHHIVPVFLGGKDSKDNAVMLCLTCHRMVHLYQTRDLYLPQAKTDEEINAMTDGEKAVYTAERDRYKRIIKLGTVIREGMHQKGINLQQYKKDHPIGNIGRNKPGQSQEKT